MTTALPAGRPQLRLGRPNRRALFRVTALLLALGSLLVLEGLTEGLMPWQIVGCPGCGNSGHVPTLEFHRWHGAEHGAVLGLLFVGSLIGVALNPLRRPLLLQFYVAGHAVVPILYALQGPIYTSEAELAALVAIMFVSAALLVALYPDLDRLNTLHPEPDWDRSLLRLTGLAALLLVPVALQRIAWQALMIGGESAIHARWTGGVILIALLLIAGVMAATRRPGWRALTQLLGVTYFYLGAAALTVPDHPGSWGNIGGGLALLAGFAYLWLAGPVHAPLRDGDFDYA